MNFSLQNILMNNALRILIKSIAILAISLIFYKMNFIYFEKQIKKLSRYKNIGEKRTRKTRIEFFRKIIAYIIFIISIIWILMLIPGFETFSISLLAGAGILAIIIGFAAQKTLSNLVSGISIAIFTPFRIGDRLKIGEEFGDVEEMNLRHTVIRTWENKRVIIPNSLISEREIINYSIKEERLLWTINMGISYDSNIDKAKKIMTDIADKHPNVITPEIKDEEEGIIEIKKPIVRVTECKDFSVNLRLYFWVEKPGKAWVTGFDLIEQIKKEFNKQGIEIPFPYRTIVYKKDLEEKKRKR